MRPIFVCSLLGVLMLGACQQSGPARTSGASSESERFIPNRDRDTGNAENTNDALVQQSGEPDRDQQPTEDRSGSQTKTDPAGKRDDRSRTGHDQTNRQMDLGLRENPQDEGAEPRSNSNLEDAEGVDVREKRLQAAREKLRELPKKSRDDWPEKYDRQAINSLERHMSKQGWSDFQFGEDSGAETEKEPRPEDP